MPLKQEEFQRLSMKPNSIGFTMYTTCIICYFHPHLFWYSPVSRKGKKCICQSFSWDLISSFRCFPSFSFGSLIFFQGSWCIIYIQGYFALNICRLKLIFHEKHFNVFSLKSWRLTELTSLSWSFLPALLSTNIDVVFQMWKEKGERADMTQRSELCQRYLNTWQMPFLVLMWLWKKAIS